MNRFTPEYKNRLQVKKKTLKLEKFIKTKTGYDSKITIQLDKAIGYVYSVRLSLDNFESYSTWIITSTTKNAILSEILANVSHFDFKNVKRGGTTKQITKRINSTILKIECMYCFEEKSVKHFHRNMKSSVINKNERRGYSFMCRDCSNLVAAQILKNKNEKTALLYLCVHYDRPYIKNVIDIVCDMKLSPVEKFGEYFRRINVYYPTMIKGNTFSLSDVFD